jgi:hypothetical protein
MKENLMSKALVAALLLGTALVAWSAEQKQTAGAGATTTAPAATTALARSVPTAGSLDGWNQVGSSKWRIENGEIVATEGGNGTLVTQDSFANVHVYVEFFVDAGTTNSGVFLRASKPDRVSDTTSYEINIYDARPDQSGRTGAIVGIAKPSQVINAAGRWNTYDITARGDHIVIVLNGVTTVDVHDSTYANGPIALQYGGSGEVRFRNIKIERL